MNLTKKITEDYKMTGNKIWNAGIKKNSIIRYKSVYIVKLKE